MSKLVSIVIPTFNESENIPTLIERIDKLFASSKWDYECIVVDDDSADGTYQVAVELGEKFQVRPFIRKEEKGLSSAIYHGFQQCRGEIIGCIDADLQHPPEPITQLLKTMEEKDYQMVIASRVIEGGGVEDWPWPRRLISWLGRMMARPLTPVRDTMSGFFFLKPSVIEGKGDQLNLIGYKICLEILVKGDHQNKVAEIPYVFQHRTQGSSKMTWRTHVAYLWQLVLLYGYKIKRLFC